MARRIPGEFVPLDLNLPRDPAIRQAGPDAELLYVRGLIYIKSARSDGVIPEYDLPVVSVGLKNPQRSAEALVAARLWSVTPGGWLCRSWLKWNLSQAEIAESKEKNRLGAIKANHKQNRHATPDPECPLCPQQPSAGFEGVA